jgi:hypothetical protein
LVVAHLETAATTVAKRATCPATALSLVKSAEVEAVAASVVTGVAAHLVVATTVAKRATCPATALSLVKSAEVEEAVAMAATVVEATEVVVIAAMVEVENQDIKDLKSKRY